MDDESILTPNQMARAIKEVVENSPGGIPEEDVLSAIEALADIAISAGIFYAWSSGKFQVGWHEGELSFRTE